MTKELIGIDEISMENAPSIYVADGLKQYIDETKRRIEGQVFDLSNASGRKACASLAFDVSKSKTAVEKKGREYLKELKAKPKIVETELREFVRSMDELRDEARKPLTDWEKAEQERIEAEQAEAERLKLLEQVENDHEMGLLMNEKFDAEKAEQERINKELEEKRKQEEKEAQERRDKEIAEQAAAKAKAEKEASEERERQAIEQAKIDKALAEQAAKLAAQKAAEEAKQAAERAEREKQEAIEAERRAIEAERKRKEEEEIKRAKDKENVRLINNAIKDDLIAAAGLTEDQAKSVITAIVKKKVTNTTISY